jgi:hypothetical protein
MREPIKSTDRSGESEEGRGKPGHDQSKINRLSKKQPIV